MNTNKQSIRRVAIIGAGPTGLRAAYDLVKRGHQVVIFDSLPQAGGALIDAMPAVHQLPALLAHDVRLLQSYGVELRLQSTVGQQIPFTDILQTFDAILLAIGNQRPAHLHVSGEKLLSGILSARQFLHTIALGLPLSIKRNIIVIGGDRTAVFAARAALHAGAQSVQILFAGTRDMLTAPVEEIEMALHEGIQLHELLTPRSFIGTEEATLHAVRCYQTYVTSLNEQATPTYKSIHRIPGTSIVIPADMVLIAVGENPDFSFLPAESVKEQCWSSENACNMEAQATEIPGLFVAGGVLYGPGTIAQALQQGEKAAHMIDAFLRNVPLSEITPLAGEELLLTKAPLYLEKSRNYALESPESDN